MLIPKSLDFMSQLPKGYKQTQVGVIPEDWDVAIAAEICEFIVDCKNRTPPIVEGEEFAVVRTPNVRNGRFVLEELRFTDANSFREWTARAIPQVGDILITREAPLGEVCLVPSNYKVCLGQRMMLYRPDQNKTDSAFFLYSLMAPSVRSCLMKKIGGSTVGHAKVDDIRNLEIPIPPTIAEQKQIARALSDIDALMEALEGAIGKKRQIKQGAMQELLTGKQRLPGFDNQWEMKRFGELVAPRSERVDPRKSGVHNFCIELEHIGSGTGLLVGSATTGSQSSLKSVFYQGDVLFGKLRAYLRKYWQANRSGVCSTEIWVLSPKDKLILTTYLFQVIQTDQFIEIATLSYGTHMPRSDWSIVKNYELFLPPTIEEQQAIATILSDMDADIAAIEAKLTKTRQLKQGMMHKLLTGRIRLV